MEDESENQHRRVEAMDHQQQTIIVASATLLVLGLLFTSHAYFTQGSNVDKGWKEFDIVAFTHAIVATVLSWYIVFFMFEKPQAYVEHILIGGQPSPIENILPMITFGYSLWDIGNGVREQNMTFIYHGVVLFLLCASLYRFDKLHFLAGPLLMELSTIFLNLRNFKSLLVDATFFFIFLFLRWILIPYLWFLYIDGAFLHVVGEKRKNNNESPLPEDYIVLIGGVLFHGLNIFWGIKVLQKGKRTCHKSSKKDA